MRNNSLKHHAWDYHIPQVFWDRSWNDLNAMLAYHQLRASCLETLAKCFNGPTGSIQDLVEHVNKEIKLPWEYPIMHRTLQQMGQLTRTMQWPKVEVFEMLPINFPAVMIHWRILLALICTMSADKRMEIKSLGLDRLVKLEKQVKVRRVRFQKAES